MFRCTGLALLCGKESGVVVYDRDNRHGASNDFVSMYLSASERVYDMTASGGNHDYFQYRECKSTRNDLLDFEVRSDGTLVVVPPSWIDGHPEKNWSWVQSPWDFKLPVLSDELYSFFYGKHIEDKKVINRIPGSNDRTSLSPKQQEVLNRMLLECRNTQKGMRSERDYRAIAWCVKCGLSAQAAQRYFDFGKFRERPDYFERTWDKALKEVVK